MAGVRLEFAQFGDFDYFNIYRNSVSTAIDNLGQPIGTSSTMYYEDLTAGLNNDYYYRVGVIRDSIEELSEEIHIRTEVVFDPPYDLIVEFKNDTTKRLELNWKLDGFVDEQRYYCSETPIDPGDLPLPKVILDGEARSYIDADIEFGKTYYVRVGSVKNGVEKYSDEQSMFAGNAWTPTDLINIPAHWIDSDSAIAESASKLVSISNNNTAKDIVFSQANGLNRPILTTYANGLRSISFNGIDQHLQSASAEILSEYKSATKAWCLVVMRKLNVDVTVRNRNIISNTPGNSSGGGRFSLGIGAITANKLYLYSERVDGTTGTTVELNHEFNNIDTNIIYAEVDFSLAKAKVVVDGLEIYNSTFGTAGSTSNTFAFWNAGIGAFIGSPPVVHCDMELLVLMQSGVSSIPPTLGETQKLEGWVAHKYGLNENLPIDHPYKILVPTL